MIKELVYTLRSRFASLGPLSAEGYEWCFGQPWDLKFDGKKITYLGDSFFRTEGILYFDDLFYYERMGVDELLDVYLVTQKMEAYQNMLLTEAFWREQGFKKQRVGGELEKEKHVLPYFEAPTGKWWPLQWWPFPVWQSFVKSRS
jgi:hypothetical protein